MRKIIDWIRTHPLESALFGGIALLGIGLTIANLATSGSETPPGASDVTADLDSGTEAQTTSTQGPAFDADVHPAFEQLACSGLITIDDVDYAFGTEGQLLSVMEFSGGETCTDTLADDREFWVTIEPGDPGDFSPGAELAAVTGSPVSGVGGDAIWFAGADESVISVFELIDSGGLYFRIRLHRPDTEPDEELEIITELARRSLPRFPGVIADQPEPVAISIDIDESDPARDGYAGNLAAKEQAGEWSRSQGLVATLRLMAGEADHSDVLRYPDLVAFDNSDIIDIAREHLASTAEDDLEAEEIEQLLSRLLPSAADLGSAEVVDAGPAAALSPLLLNLTFTQEDPVAESFCVQNYGTGNCLNSKKVETEFGDYTLYWVKDEFETNWTAEHLEIIEEAIQKSASELGSIGNLPGTSIILNPNNVAVSIDIADSGYVANLGFDMAFGLEGVQLGQLQQVVAYAMAAAMVAGEYGDLWLVDGMALYLSGFVYPDVNYEHRFAQALAQFELSKPLTEWGITSWLFFEYLDSALGGAGPVFGFGQLSPTQISSLFHGFAQALTDSQVPDLGFLFDYVPYDAQVTDLPINFLFNANLAPPPFTIRRFRLIVEPGQHACIDVLTSGAVQFSWRGPGENGAQQQWDTEVPPGVSGESTLLVTSTGEGFLDFAVTRFVEDPEDCEEEPEQATPQEWEPLAPDCPTFCDPTAFLWNPNVVHIRIESP